jgi:hypothetical protein
MKLTGTDRDCDYAIMMRRGAGQDGGSFAAEIEIRPGADASPAIVKKFDRYPDRVFVTPNVILHPTGSAVPKKDAAEQHFRQRAKELIDHALSQ